MSKLVTDDLRSIAKRAHEDRLNERGHWCSDDEILDALDAAIESIAHLIAARVIEECARIAYFSSEEAARYIRDEVPKRLGIV